MIKNIAILFFVFFCFVSSSKAQSWGGGNDDNTFSFGFHFQYLTSEYKILKKENWKDPYFDPAAAEEKGAYVSDKLAAIYSKPIAGSGVGGIFKVRLHNNIDLRFTPMLTFSERELYYDYLPPLVNNPGVSTIKKNVQAAMFEMPMAFKLKSDRFYDIRPYLLIGTKYSLNIASQKKVDDRAFTAIEKLVKNKDWFFSYEAGFGVDIYFEYFKMTPEVKLSYSFNDILKHENTPFANPIDQLFLRSLCFSLFLQ
ncbi:MAG: outer membrane beta-barrel protein [Sphingobacteriaceae bacterium]|nr:outer membrane beta-barrel protein [Sphingobacteriaceae bacterium]